MGAGTTQATASAAAEAVLSSLLTLASAGEKVHISRFGTFEYQTRRAHRAYDINAERMNEVPERRKLTFRPASGFIPRTKG